jgi:hypothetical protein
MEGPTTVFRMPSREYRLSVIAANGHKPHPWRRSARKRWGLPVCAECNLTEMYVAHHDDLRES